MEVTTFKNVVKINNMDNYLRYYDILGVPPTASLDEIKSAYRRLAKQYHPDKNKDPDSSRRFIEITEAYQRLTETSPPLQPGIYVVTLTLEEAYNGCIKDNIVLDRGVDTGDLLLYDNGFVVYVQVEPHRFFYRRGIDLWIQVDIDLIEALTGDIKVILNHLDGNRYILRLQQPELPIQPGTVKIATGLGMVRKGRVGDLYIVLQVTLPILSSDEVQSIRSIIPRSIIRSVGCALNSNTLTPLTLI
jgi:DnaJ-class molecular chaperone